MLMIFAPLRKSMLRFLKCKENFMNKPIPQFVKSTWLKVPIHDQFLDNLLHHSWLTEDWFPIPRDEKLEAGQ